VDFRVTLPAAFRTPGADLFEAVSGARRGASPLQQGKNAE
jgi:hypothetical protein